MNAPSQTLICNPQIEWSKLPYICLLSAFPRLFPLPLLDLLQVDLTRSLASFSSLAIYIKSEERPFWKSTPLFVWVCAFDRKKMLKVGGKKRKEKKESKRKRKKERKRKSTQTQLPGFELALLRQLLASRAWNFTTQPQENKIHWIAEYHVTITRPTVWKRNTSHAVSEANKNKKVKLIVQISFAEKIKFKEEGSVTFQNFFLQWPTFVM